MLGIPWGRRPSACAHGVHNLVGEDNEHVSKYVNEMTSGHDKCHERNMMHSNQEGQGLLWIRVVTSSRSRHVDTWAEKLKTRRTQTCKDQEQRL